MTDNAETPEHTRGGQADDTQSPEQSSALHEARAAHPLPQQL